MRLPIPPAALACAIGLVAFAAVSPKQAPAQTSPAPTVTPAAEYSLGVPYVVQDGNTTNLQVTCQLSAVPGGSSKSVAFGQATHSLNTANPDLTIINIMGLAYNGTTPVSSMPFTCSLQQLSTATGAWVNAVGRTGSVTTVTGSFSPAATGLIMTPKITYITPLPLPHVPVHQPTGPGAPHTQM